MIVSVAFNKYRCHGIRHYLCLECKGILNKKHLSRSYTCLLCGYRTNCSWSFFEHVVEMHSKKSNLCNHQPQMKKISFCYKQLCKCGFKSRNGMVLADHLVNCRMCLGFMSLRLPELKHHHKKNRYISFRHKFCYRHWCRHAQHQTTSDPPFKCHNGTKSKLKHKYLKVGSSRQQICSPVVCIPKCDNVVHQVDSPNMLLPKARRIIHRLFSPVVCISKIGV